MTLPASFVLRDLKESDVVEGEMIPKSCLDGDTLKHLKSRRIARGELVEFFNGSGLRASTICEDPLSARYRIKTIIQEESLKPAIELCLPLVKSELLSEALAQATEVGVSSIRWIKTEHDQVPKSLKKIPVERARRVCQAAIEQCSRPWKVTVEDDWSTLDESVQNQDYWHIVADEGLSDKSFIGFEVPPSFDLQTKPIRLYIGPEGGWSDSERAFFRDRGVSILSLGRLILRVPTAIVASVFFLRCQNRQSR